MAEVNVIDFRVHPFRAERFWAAWQPALERAAAFGARDVQMIRAEEDPLHFRQTSTWDSRDDFAAYWASDEVVAARMDAFNYYNKPLYPTWHVLVGATE